MRTTHRTGPWWFMQEISKFLNRNPPDSDGEHFITNLTVTKQIDWLPQLRNWYAYILLLKRLRRKTSEQYQLKHWLNYQSRPGQRDGVWTRINELSRQIFSIEKRMNKLPNPYLELIS